jgi:hypothetical protein
VSATHLPGEHLQVTVYGRAVEIDHRSPSQASFREALLDIYEPRYGCEEFAHFIGSGAMYARIDAERMFTCHIAEPLASLP